jgi:hypothetical protein
MPELDDYSGPFNPDMKLTDFSKEALARLLLAASKMYLGADGMWTTVIRKKFGEDVALECSKEVWATNWKQEVRRPTEAMNIHGDDIATMFKFFQVDPGFAVMFDMDFELSDDGKRGKLTVTRCRTLEYCERHNDTWLQNLACNELDGPLIPETARLFNPKMACRALKLPPRKSPDEIPCQWEFWIEE